MIRKGTLKRELEFKVLGKDKKVLGKPGDFVEVDRDPNAPGGLVLYLNGFNRQCLKFAKVDAINLPDTVQA